MSKSGIHSLREHIVRIKLEAVSMDSTIVKVHPDGTGALKKTDPRPSASPVVALSVILLTLVACGDSSTPAPDPSRWEYDRGYVASSLQARAPQRLPSSSTPADRCAGDTLSPTSLDGHSTWRSVLESTPTSTSGPDTSPTSLDDYLATCTGATSGPTEDDFTFEEFSAAWEEVTEQLEAVNPPEEIADWHAAVLVYQRAVMEVLDDAPRRGEGVSEDEYIISVLFPVALQHQPDVTEAIKGMNPDLIARMIEAGCIDEDTLSIHLTPEEMKALGVSPGGTAGGKVITEFASISAGQKITPAG